MSKFNSYYPGSIGNQILWLNNWIGKIAGYQAALGYSAAEIAANLADAARILYLLETVQGEAQSFAVSITSHIDLIQNGSSGSMVDIPRLHPAGRPAAAGQRHARRAQTPLRLHRQPQDPRRLR